MRRSCARAWLRAHYACLKIKNLKKKSQKTTNFFWIFFPKFIFLCLMCVNNTINYFSTPYTMKSSKFNFFWIPMKFDDFNVKSFQNLKNYNLSSSVILNFWKKLCALCVQIINFFWRYINIILIIVDDSRCARLMERALYPPQKS